MTAATLAWRTTVAAIALAGVALRFTELGTWGLSNDEAWVGLATRVEGIRQTWLAVSMTPVAWAALVKVAAVAVGGSELALRLVPFGFGCLGMAAALVLGWRVAGRLGGVLALAVVAFDPLQVEYARILKQYTAEVFLALLALERTVAYAARRDRASLVVLSLVLALGVPFANAQLLVAPPVFAALVLGALVRRDRRVLRDVVLAAAVVGACDLLYARFVIAPRLPTSLDAYWAGQTYLPADPVAASRLLWSRLGWTLGPALGSYGYVAALVAVVLACVVPGARTAAAVVGLLVLEVWGLSVLHRVPVSQPRVLLFLTAAVGAVGAASLAALAVRAAVRPVAAGAIALALALLGWDFVRAHPWSALPHVAQVEDVGPFVREVESERTPDDTVLVHGTSLFVFAYYQRATPVLDPLPSISVGYLPRPPDPRVVVMVDRDVAERAHAAMASSRRVWVVASRLRAPREQALRAALAPLGAPARDEQRRGALLLRFDRRGDS